MVNPYPLSAAIDLDDMKVVYGEIEAASTRLSGVIRRTPVESSRALDLRVGAKAVLKCENFQRTGAFKIRGAYNALSQLSDADRLRGVLTYSSGNHAQAAALAGRLLGIDVAIIMPSDAPETKLEATRGYGGNVILYDRRETTREELAVSLTETTGRTMVPPYDHPHIVAGQGTVAKELFDDVGELDLLLVPCGGGGLLSGCALSADALSPGCRVIGIEPEEAADATASFHTGQLHQVDDPQTIADGARTPYLGRVTFPLIRRYVHDMVTVSDEAVIRAMRFLFERMKLVVEPTGALAVAALLEGKVPPTDRIGVVISGGNVDLAKLGEWFGGDYDVTR